MNDNNSILVSFFLGRNLLGKDYATPNSCAVWRNKIAECYRRGSLHHSTVDTSYIYSLCPPMPTCLLKTVLVLADLSSGLAQTSTGIKQSSCKQLALWLYEFCFASTLVTSSWLNSMAMCHVSQNFCVRCENSKKFSRDHRSMSWASWLSIWTPKCEGNSLICVGWQPHGHLKLVIICWCSFDSFPFWALSLLVCLGQSHDLGMTKSRRSR